jgi:N-carbamoyl-L-amino-acid hydrolase
LKLPEQLLSNKHMPFGAGHNAQIIAPICPTATIIVPSESSISQNVAGYTAPVDLEKGANLLLRVMLNKTG